MCELLFLGVNSPIQVGIYHQRALTHAYSRNGKLSDELYRLFLEILDAHTPSALYYIKGPGSFMAIKLSYVFLKTLSIARSIPFFGADSFAFNGGMPIHAYGNSYFTKHNGEITLQQFDAPLESAPFELPASLDPALFTTEQSPLYILPPV